MLAHVLIPKKKQNVPNKYFSHTYMIVLTDKEKRNQNLLKSNAYEKCFICNTQTQQTGSLSSTDGYPSFFIQTNDAQSSILHFTFVVQNIKEIKYLI